MIYSKLYISFLSFVQRFRWLKCFSGSSFWHVHVGVGVAISDCYCPNEEFSQHKSNFPSTNLGHLYYFWEVLWCCWNVSQSCGLIFKTQQDRMMNHKHSPLHRHELSGHTHTSTYNHTKTKCTHTHVHRTTYTPHYVYTQTWMHIYIYIYTHTHKLSLSLAHTHTHTHTHTVSQRTPTQCTCTLQHWHPMTMPSHIPNGDGLDAQFIINHFNGLYCMHADAICVKLLQQSGRLDHRLPAPRA